ncbi:hypothetical protein E2562_020612 [Oryza meyeriana var. granulata]|uniref:Uncharacterized protein n=1 Tax=Oryza meyeriana var. granulata TaxID=110450 RepID=A0A6G1DYC2_9ORYZ|nr:hypothetical protein E2562_020612 [Oryza meyeriana var. granulata]
MSCTVAIPSSPVFSPSRRPLSCKAASASAFASPESVSVAVSSLAQAPAAGSPLRPFVLRAHHLREEASSSPQPATAGALRPCGIRA